MLIADARQFRDREVSLCEIGDRLPRTRLDHRDVHPDDVSACFERRRLRRLPLSVSSTVPMARTQNVENGRGRAWRLRMTWRHDSMSNTRSSRRTEGDDTRGDRCRNSIPIVAAPGSPRFACEPRQSTPIAMGDVRGWHLAARFACEEPSMSLVTKCVVAAAMFAAPVLAQSPNPQNAPHGRSVRGRSSAAPAGSGPVSRADTARSDWRSGAVYARLSRRRHARRPHQLQFGRGAWLSPRPTELHLRRCSSAAHVFPIDRSPR